jgi:Fe-S cluster assembly protein SufD
LGWRGSRYNPRCRFRTRSHATNGIYFTMIEQIEEKKTWLDGFTEFEHSAAAGGRSWLADSRRRAIQRFEEMGFPTTRQEEWRFTNVSPIARTPFKLAVHGRNGLTVADLSNYTFGEADCTQLVFVDGHFSRHLTTLGSLSQGLRLTNLATAVETDRDLVEPHLARYASTGENPFTALNTAFMADGAFLYVPPGTVLKNIIHLLFISTRRTEATVSHPRNLLVIGNGGCATIVESYVGPERGVYFTNAVTELALGVNSVVDHYKLQRESTEAFHVGRLQVLQQQDSSFSSHSLSLGGALVRNDVNVVLDAKGSGCALNGLYVTRGKQHVDNHTSIDHARPNCSSRQLYKGILDGSSTGVFNGRILVRQDAQKTNARQTNKNLLLSEEALANSTPQLEIFADDVKCTHGATIGRLDEEGLFYLRSRGIDEASARTLLTYAFATEILSAVKVKPIQCQIDLVLLTLLSGLRG